MSLSLVSDNVRFGLSNSNQYDRHWRFISSFHGPWLQLPLELLESLAAGNYFSARPHTIDASVFFDVVRIRKLIDEATNLSVRAVNGTGLSALGASLNSGHGIRTGSGGGPMKLSNERRFRMRELAVKKLSEAYHLDEIAASVATMQSTSSLEDVAKLVLQRNPNDIDAKYVHFFHEKIPSRALVEISSLQPLSDILQDQPSDCAILRTRAMTKIFKDDFAGASKDLTEAIGILRRESPRHMTTQRLDTVIKDARPLSISKWEPKYDLPKLSDKEKPTGLQAQLYFQRAGIYVSLACQSVNQALHRQPSSMKISGSCIPTDTGIESAETLDSYRKVKFNAKRALRDYISFLSKLEYTPGMIHQVDDRTIPKANGRITQSIETGQLFTASSEDLALVPSGEGSMKDPIISVNRSNTLPTKVYPVSDLFSPTTPVYLPQFPSVSTSLAKLDLSEQSRRDRLTKAEHPEMVSYHPLLTETLHGLLLCHALLQTDKAQLNKYALMVARLVSLSDGFPVFISARSASRADWIDILDQTITKSWLDIGVSWDQLCKPDTLNPAVQQKSTPHTKDAKKRQTSTTSTQLQPTMTSSAAPQSLEIQTDDTTPDEILKNPVTRANLKAYSLGTERADIIARWIMEAPVLPDFPMKPRKGKKKGARGPAAVEIS